MRQFCFALAFALILGGCAGPRHSRGLDSSVLGNIQEAIFEVVVLKPTQDSLSYAKPLPMELLPYAVRTDKYYSIGTAFAIAPERFMTAAHVLNPGVRSQYQQVFLRDRSGAVYPIDQVFKYSDARDFVIFSLQGKKATQILPLHTSPRLNDKVYAVGNAFGEGIVIRDGLYTSDTPEELEGNWKWMRFSAAASPGNSGGPLLDQQGRVIGVVMKKSPDENLNFALPIVEVLQSPENMAVVHRRMVYSLDIMETQKRGTLEQQIPLPKSYRELDMEMIKSGEDFAGQLLRDLLAENRNEIFPNGKGSEILLNQTSSAVFPHLIMRGKDGNWGAHYPSERTRADIGRNGSVAYGSLGSALFIRLVKPDDVALEQLYNDSKLFMDLLLQGIYSTREVGLEKIKITSLGKAQEEYIFTDSYQRKWLVKTWLMEYSDHKVVTFSLPVPGGCITMLRSDQTGQVDMGHIADLKTLTNFIYVSYYGTFGQWRELLAMKDFLPAALATINFSFDYNKSFSYRSPRVSFTYGPSLLKVDEASDLELGFTYFKDKDRTVWDVSEIVVGDDKNNGNFFRVSRKIRPPADLSDTYRSDWNNTVGRRIPYDNTAFFKDKKTLIGDIFQNNRKQRDLSESPLLYTVIHGMDGNSEQAKMGDRLQRFMQNMRVLEN